VALMCAADATLETLGENGETSLAALNDWGTVHICRGYQAVWESAAAQRATNDGGIDYLNKLDKLGAA
jgi:restriction endonuclease Mrr